MSQYHRIVDGAEGHVGASAPIRAFPRRGLPVRLASDQGRHAVGQTDLVELPRFAERDTATLAGGPTAPVPGRVTRSG